MDRLPLELLHTVCRHLRTADVGNFRLVSKTFAAVGQQYLLPEIHTVFHTDALERLESISKHPIYSKYVTSLFHEGDTLCQFDSMVEWERYVVQPHDDREVIPERPAATASDREKRAYVRAMNKIARRPRHQYSSDELAEGWKNYLWLLDMQEAMRTTHDDEKLLHHAMSRLPRLRSITLFTLNYSRECTPAMKRLFGSALVPLLGDSGHVEYANHDFFTKLLLGVDFAKTKLENLDAGFVNWRFITADDPVFARMRNSVRHLKTLSLRLFTDDDEEDTAECFHYLENGRLREFVTAAPDLTELEVRFDEYDSVEEYPAELCQIVGEFTWPNLKTVEFHCILASEEDLLDFFERHASTLKRVSLAIMTLSDGAWITTLQGMRQILSLEDFDINGDLCSTAIFDHWVLEPRDIWEPEETCLRKALRRYFLEEGLECPLLDAKFLDSYQD